MILIGLQRETPKVHRGEPKEMPTHRLPQAQSCPCRDSEIVLDTDLRGADKVCVGRWHVGLALKSSE